MNKKQFQKTIKAIREELFAGNEYPKAMMTTQQMEKNTATVNCGGEWWRPEQSHDIAGETIIHPAFKKLIEESNATATIEPVGKCGGVQIRINY